MEGFQAGLNSFAYIGMLLIIVFYVYAILGLYIFGQNDPAHFGNLLAAMISLFRCATLSAWYELLYINWYGCDVYPAGAYVLAPHLASPFDDGVVVARAGSVTSSAGGADDGPASGGDQPLLLVDTGAGHFPAFVCSNPSSQPTSSMLYFFTFTLLANYVILSLLVGVVTISMQVRTWWGHRAWKEATRFELVLNPSTPRERVWICSVCERARLPFCLAPCAPRRRR